MNLPKITLLVAVIAMQQCSATAQFTLANMIGHSMNYQVQPNLDIINAWQDAAIMIYAQ